MKTTTKRIVTLIAAIALTGAISACSVFNGSETSGEYVDDATITSKVKAQIVDQQSLKGFQIHVETFQGVVQLSGFVGSESNKTMAENVTHNVRGVKAVRDDLIVR